MGEVINLNDYLIEETCHEVWMPYPVWAPDNQATVSFLLTVLDEEDWLEDYQ